MTTKAEWDKAYRDLADHSGTCIAIVAREPGKADRTLFVSADETESRAVCYPALQIIVKRSRSAK